MLVKSEENRAILYENDRFVTIEKNAKIHTLKPIRTQIFYATEEVFFSNISPDSLNRLISGKPIISLTIQSNTEFGYQKNNLPETGKRAELTYTVNPVFTFQPIEKQLADTSSTEARRRILQYEIAKEQERVSRLRSEKAALESQVRNLSEKINNLELYEREKATKELAQLKSELSRFPEIQDHTTKMRIQLQGIKTTRSIETEPIQISGYLNIITL